MTERDRQAYKGQDRQDSPNGNGNGFGNEASHNGNGNGFGHELSHNGDGNGHKNGHRPFHDSRPFDPVAVMVDAQRNGVTRLSRLAEDVTHVNSGFAKSWNRAMEAASIAWGNPFAAGVFRFLGNANAVIEAETAYPEISDTQKNMETVWQPEDGYPYKLSYFKTHEDLLHIEKNGEAIVIQYAAMSDPSVLYAEKENFIRAAQEKGYEVFLSDCGSPGSRHEDIGLDDIALRYLDTAVDKIDEFCEQNNIPLNKKILYGICQGGYIAAGYNAVRPGRFDAQVLVVPYLTNQGGGEIVRMIQEDESFDAKMDLIEAINHRLIPGAVLVDGAAGRDEDKYIYGPHERLVQDVINGNQKGIDIFVRNNGWTKKSREIGMKPRAHSQIVDEIIRKDMLVKGEVKWRYMEDGEEKEVMVDLANTVTPTLLVKARRDDLVPTKGLEAVYPLFGDGTLDKEEFEVDATHFEGTLKGFKAQTITWPYIFGWLGGERHPEPNLPAAA